MEDKPKDPEIVYKDSQDASLRNKFSKVLNSPIKKKGMYDFSDERVIYSWEEIFNEIGKLQEKAESKKTEYISYPVPTCPSNTVDPNLHYHNGIPCRQNPCYWAGTPNLTSTPWYMN